MVVYLARTNSREHSVDVYKYWQEMATADVVGKHRVTDNPHEADCVLIVDVLSHGNDPLTWDLRNHPIWKQGYKTILAYDERDWPRYPLAGLAVSLPHSQHKPAIHRAAPYFRTMQKFEQPLDGEPDLLFSFIGAESHVLRERIFALKYPRSIVESSGVNYFDANPTEQVVQKQQEQKRIFREVLQRSKFVLCPRGEGISSFRTYEVMAAGRVPVIIADGWLPPQGPNWNDFAVFVSEADVENIPNILEQYEPKFKQMAQGARAAFDFFYGPSKIFSHIIDLCSDLVPLKQSTISYRFPPKLALSFLRHKMMR